MQLSAEGFSLIKNSKGFATASIATSPVFPHRLRHLIKPADLSQTASPSRRRPRSWPATFKTPNRLRPPGQGPADTGSVRRAGRLLLNLGAGRLPARLLCELNAGHDDAAALQLLAWDHAGGVVNSGLRARRQARVEVSTRSVESNLASASRRWKGRRAATKPTPPNRPDFIRIINRR